MSRTERKRVEMALFYDWGFFVEPGKDDEFRAWLAENNQKMLDLAPKNYEYLGTYRPLGAADPCDYHQVWRYADRNVPNLRVAAADDSGEFTQLAKEYLAFVDQSRQDEEKFNLYGPVAP